MSSETNRNSKLRIIICGGRDYSDSNRLNGVLDVFLPIKDQITIIQGGARGADILARHWAIRNKVVYEEHQADWNVYGRSAGSIRNRQMFDSGCDLVIAFPGKIGTPDMCRYAESKGCEVIKVDWC